MNVVTSIYIDGRNGIKKWVGYDMQRLLGRNKLIRREKREKWWTGFPGGFDRVGYIRNGKA